MMAWATHFGGLCESIASTDKHLPQLYKKMNILAQWPNEEDVPFSLDETVKKFTPQKACGPDVLTADHLKWSGGAIICWLEELPSWDRFHPTTKGMVKTHF